MNMIFSGTGLFLRYWDIGTPTPFFYQTPSPGKIKGINTNTSIVSGMNLGINHYVSDEHKKAALEIIKYFTSEEIQREIIVKKYGLFTGITEFYDEEEICLILSCPLVKNARGVTRILDVGQNENYYQQITEILDSYLYGNNTPEYAINKIVNINKSYNYSIDTTLGLLMFILLISMICFIIILFLVFRAKKYDKYFRFFTIDLYWMYCIGIILTLCSELFKFGTLTNFKCQMGFSMYFIGLSVSYIPIIYKLFTSFPDLGYRLKIYCQIHKKKFIAYCIFIELAVNLLFIFSPFKVENKIYNDSDGPKHYKKCTIKYTSGNYILILEILEKITMMVIISLLSFCEWNVIEIFDNIRSIVITIYVNALLFALYIVVFYVPLNKIDVISTISSLIILITAFSNYVLIHIIKIHILKITKKYKKESLFENTTVRSVTDSSTKSNSKFSVFGKIVNYHYTQYSIVSESATNNTTIKTSNLMSQNIASSANYSFN